MTMTRRYRTPSLLFFLVLIAPFVLLSQSSAQQPSQQSLPSSAQHSQPTEHSQTSQSAEERKKKVSQIEKETGTVNDRFFDAMPNYVVEDAMKLPPLTPRQKFGLANASLFDPFTVPFVGFLAAVDQANDSPPSWGQGWGPYGERFGEEFGDNGIGTYMTVAIFPTILREDSRYYVMKRGRVAHRAFYSISRLFVTFTDSGNTSFNYSEIIGNAAAAAASNIYHPPEDRTVGRNLGTWGMLIMWDGASNEMKEFWPDIRRKLFHKNRP